MVECVDARAVRYITKGNVYKVANRDNTDDAKTYITDDRGNNRAWYQTRRFKKVTEPKPSPIKAGNTVECVDVGSWKNITKGKLYPVTKARRGDSMRITNDCGDNVWYYVSRFKKVNKPKQEKAKGECSMICSTVIVTNDKDGNVTAVDDLELSVAKSLGQARLDRAVKSADKLKDKPNKSVMAVEEKFQGVE